MKQKLNTPKKISYVASKFTTGLTDLTIVIRKPDGTLFGSGEGEVAPIFTEQGDGVYITEYVPNIEGIWQEKVISVLNGDKAFRSFEVVNYVIGDVKLDTISIKQKTDNLPENTAQELTNISNKQEVIEGKIDNLDFQISPGGYFI